MISHQVRQICGVITAVFLGWGVGMAVADTPKTLTVYSGREKDIMSPLIEKAKKDLGINIEVRYGDSTELAIALIEEGKNSRADIFYAQDAGSLGAIAREKRTLTLPTQLLNKVEPQFRSPAGQWIGISGRARVIDYNTKLVKTSELPTSVMELGNPKWQIGRAHV